MSFVYFNSSVV